MKLLKIGSSQSCDIVLHSKYVSSLHAEMILMDNGDIILVDKGSTNGTVVGNKKIEPNRDVKVRRGDLVRFGDADLVWDRVPSLPKNNNWKQVLNIGSNFRNDIVVNSGVVSRFHGALMIDKDNKVFIVDNNSTNGTQVNGMKIQPNKPHRLKKGDNVICGSEDITDQIAMYIKSSVPAWAAWLGGILAVAAVCIGVYFAMPYITGKGGGNENEGLAIGADGKTLPTITVQNAREAVVYVRAKFHFEVSVENNILDSEHKSLLVKETEHIPYQATAFFVDSLGRMATNRHVAVPWAEEYREEGLTETLISEYKKFINESLGVSSIDVLMTFAQDQAIKQLQRSELGQAIIEESEGYDDVMAKIETIRNSKVVISGKIDDITVGYAGKYYNYEDDFQRCHVLAESGTKDQDIAILELNDKVTPKNIRAVFWIDNIFEGTLEPQKDDLNLVGYPLGIEWNQSEETKSLEPSNKSTRCSKVPEYYVFEFQDNNINGSSGSPLFNAQGQLVGVLFSGIKGQAISKAVQAKWLKELYVKSGLKQ